MDTTPCQLGDVTCAYYVEGAACVAFCDLDALAPAWSVRCYGCNSECPEPEPDSFAAELDTSDCEMRPLLPCPDGALTLQDELDQMLREAIGGQHAPLGEINESRLFVDFENGCPSRFHYPGTQPLTTLGPLLMERLGQARWACALGLSCSKIEGPSTLVSQ